MDLKLTKLSIKPWPSFDGLQTTLLLVDADDADDADDDWTFPLALGLFLYCWYSFYCYS
jgi:hypothetical protein